MTNWLEEQEAFWMSVRDSDLPVRIPSRFAGPGCTEDPEAELERIRQARSGNLDE